MYNKINSIELSNYIINKMYDKKMTINHLKLQKLLYYVESWHLVFTGEKIVDDNFEAWLHGPVVRNVWNHFKKHSTMFEELPCPEFKEIDLNDEQREIIDDVLNEYGKQSGYYLECLTHTEAPWREANQAEDNAIISPESMKKYYSELLNAH